MYVPKYYQGEGTKDAVSFINRFNFGCIITTIDNIPIATHLPFVVTENENRIILTSHFAKANNQWKHITTNKNLVIFSEPHAYISPKHYNKKENVPTWNYISIHAYGTAHIIDDEKDVFMTLESMMNAFEPKYKSQWDALSSQYKSNMAKGIVAFNIEVSELQMQEKLSQNKKENERKSIIDSFGNSENYNEKIIADYMRNKE